MKKVPLHQVHVDLGAKMIPFAGFDMPVRYSSDKEEHLTVREGVGVFDVSHMGEFFITGEGALELIQKVSSNDACNLQIGQAQYSCLPNTKGGIVDDLIIYRLGENEYLLVVNASNIEKDWDWIRSHNDFGATMTNQSADWALLAVQGPKAAQVLQPLTAISLDDIGFYRFVQGKLADVHMIISATGYTGAGGFELYIPALHAEEVWRRIFAAGASKGIRPIGLGARDTLRLEMGYCLYGNDITDDTSPLEAGLGWITKFNKEFIHSAVLKQQKEAGVERKLVGFVLKEKGIPRNGYELKDSTGQGIGHVTSGSLSPVLGKGIGLGYVSIQNSKPGTAIGVQIRNKTVPAEVIKPPFIPQ